MDPVSQMEVLEALEVVIETQGLTSRLASRASSHCTEPVNRQAFRVHCADL